MKTETYTCAGCGTSVTRPVARGQRPKWCPDCRRARQYVDRTCRVCGSVWQTPRADAKYCSRKCYGTAQRGKSHAKPKQLVLQFPQRGTGILTLLRQQRYAEALRSILDRTETLPSGCRVIKGKADVPYPRIGGREAHRLVLWAKTAGPIDGWQAHHLCGNTSCVEPGHIVPATAAQNVAEMLARKTYEAEIEALRRALADYAPDHPLLREGRLRRRG